MTIRQARQPHEATGNLTARTIHAMVKCRKCKAVGRVSGLRYYIRTVDRYRNPISKAVDESYGDLVCDCGAPRDRLDVRGIQGTFNPDHKCNDRCLSSHGPVCDCSCGGKNHGAAYSVA